MLKQSGTLEIAALPRGGLRAIGPSLASHLLSPRMKLLKTVVAVVWLLAPPLATAQEQGVHALLGREVSSVEGERLGEIAGVLLDSRPAGVHYVFVAVPSLDAERKRLAYPVNALRARDGRLLLNVRPERLAASPGFEGRDWPDPRFRTGERYLRARTALGRPVEDALGNRVGRLRDIFVNLESGHTSYFVVQFEQGAETLELPAHQLRLHPKHNPTLDADSERRA
jgi:sporulation protein YlmC with PRC-barrel domain